MKSIATALVFALLCACAKPPSQIASVDPDPSYAAVSCKDLLPKLRAEEAVLGKLIAIQEKAAQRDAAGVAFIGLPVGSMSGGNNEMEIAVSKGKVKALRARQEECSN